ncbi:MAG: nucleotide exchange factor GrpE [Patescibacteria group bacterium]|nr:MAG: nucleotide exchange factor GrpE [Patescibacteria group bacterium]
MEEEKKNEELAETPEKTPEQLCAEMELNWKRALADYQNLQKDVARERAEMGQYATLRVVERFLPIFDNFNTALAHMPKSDDKTVVNWAVGVGFIQKQLEEALRNLGLTIIKTAGETFDATKHEAVGEEDEGKPHGTILKEVQAGYEIGGKTVRPAKVIVNK